MPRPCILHSQTLESMFAHIPGLYVVYPATPYDAKGMLKSAIRNDNPIMFVESQLLYTEKGPVPEGEAAFLCLQVVSAPVATKILVYKNKIM